MKSNAAEQQQKLRRLLALVVAGMLAFVVVALVAILIARTRAIPVLTVEAFSRAQAQWDRQKASDYDIQIDVSGMQPATYRVEVRDGRPRSATCNGNPLRDERTLGTWSVPGMFGTVGRDVESMQKAERTKTPSTLFLRAEFDPQYGIPRRYLRSDQQQNITTSWEVIEFRVLSGEEDRK